MAISLTAPTDISQIISFHGPDCSRFSRTSCKFASKIV